MRRGPGHLRRRTRKRKRPTATPRRASSARSPPTSCATPTARRCRAPWTKRPGGGRS